MMCNFNGSYEVALASGSGCFEFMSGGVMAVRERTLSEFLQHSGQVLPELADGEIVLRRRDGEDLVIMTRRQSEALQTVLRAYFALADGDGSAVQTALPWLSFLSTGDRAACLRELREVGAAALHSDKLSRLAETLYAWEATGLAAWDMQRRTERALSQDEDHMEIPRPSR